MQRTKWLSTFLSLLVVLALALAVGAQDDTGDDAELTPEASTPTQEATPESDDEGDVEPQSIIPAGGSGLLTLAQGTRFVTGFQGAVPLNANVLGVAYLTGFDTYAFDLATLTGLTFNFGPRAMPTPVAGAEVTAEPSLSQMLAECGLVRVYKVSDEGSQDLWPNVACEGTTLTIVAGGTGHYILYRFASNAAVANAPETLSTCIGAFGPGTVVDGEATPEAGVTAATGALASSIQLDGGQVCWNFDAIRGLTAPAQVVATVAPPTTGGTGDTTEDDDNDADGPEATEAP